MKNHLKKLCFYFLVPVFFLGFIKSSNAQILTIDKVSNVIDTTQNKKLFTFLTFGISFIQEEVGILDLKTSADLFYFFKKDVLYSITQYTLSATDKVNYVNTGYSHLRYRMNNESVISPEFFVQYQWDEVRGMKNRALGGSNLRFTLLNDSLISIFAGLGLMYEYEVWDYRGVPSEKVPENATDEHINSLKLNSYLKINKQFDDYINLIFITYLQARPDNNIVYPRISPSLRLDIKVYKKVSFSFNFNSIYDFKPIVPIRNFYYSFSNTITLKI